MRIRSNNHQALQRFFLHKSLKENVAINKNTLAFLSYDDFDKLAEAIREIGVGEIVFKSPHALKVKLSSQYRKDAYALVGALKQL